MFLRQRLSVAVQRGNANCVLETLQRRLFNFIIIIVVVITVIVVVVVVVIVDITICSISA